MNMFHIRNAVFEVHREARRWTAGALGVHVMAAQPAGRVKQRFSSLVLAVALAALALPIGAPPARAQTTRHPQGSFAAFSQCPLEDPKIIDCLLVETKSGEARIGSLTAPFSRDMIGLDGGLLEGPTEEATIFAAPVNGVIMQPVPMPVPGGLSRVLESSALPHSLGYVSGKLESVGFGALTATVEVAGPASAINVSVANAVNHEGVVIEEPLKIKLTSQVLGEHCYIGTDSDPMHIKLTEELTDPPLPNMPIIGARGPLAISPDGSLATLDHNSLVDNSFAVPAASGCGGSQAPAIDEIIDSKLKLPSPAGHNTLVLNGRASAALATSVAASE